MDLIVDDYVMLFIITMVMHTVGSLNSEGCQEDNFTVTVGTRVTTSDNKFGITSTQFLWDMDLSVGAHIHGLVQDCSSSIANALELLQSCAQS